MGKRHVGRATNIYLVTNRLNGKRYVGKTYLPIHVRWKSHVRDANCGSERHFQRAIRSHGADSFVLMLLEVVTEEESAEAEQAWIKKLKCRTPTGYNLTEGGEGLSGYSHTEATRKKISAILKGRVQNPEWIAKAVAARKGFRHSEESKKLMHEKASRPESIARIKEIHTGKTYSADTRQKIKILKSDPILRAVVSAKLRGIKRSKSTIDKIAATVRMNDERGLPNKVGLRGVSVNKRGFMAHHKVNNRSVFLGYFETALDAHAAYMKAKNEPCPV